MKNKFNFIKRTAIMFLSLAVMAVAFNSCQKAFEFDLPDSNSKVDTNLPDANFSYASTSEDFKTVKFNNLSFESTTFLWDFGNGNTSTDQDPTFTFPGEGTYTVTLTSSDGRGESDVTTIEVQVVEGPFQPIIQEPGFEDKTLPDGSGDGRDSWRSSLGGVIQITGSPVTFGSQGAKMPDDQTRVGYQEIVVEAETNYDLTFWYTMKQGSTDPFVTVAIVGVSENGPITTRDEANAATIASVTVTDTEDEAVYIEQKLSFSSGANDKVAIYFFNGPVEARLDDFSIEIGAEGAVPPSAGFDVAQSADNFLEYTFTNTSKNGATYLWDFGDGNTSTEESPTHIYATPDNYNVTLEVTSENGLSGTLEKGNDIQAPVTADCSWTAHPDDYQTILFEDASIGAAELLWEFGDGYQFTGMNPEHTYTDDGIYTVTLTSKSVTGLADVHEFTVTVSQGFIASIKEAGFEPNDPSGAACGALNGKDCWRNSALGGVIQITSGPKLSGEKAAKLPSDGSRIGYQRVMVEPNRQYTVTFNYTMKTSPEGSLTVSILDGSTLADISEVAGATIASKTVNDQTDANAYIAETITFNSGSRSEVAIFFSNVDVESRLDDFSIEAAEVFIPTVSEAGFEPNDPTGAACGSTNGKDCWRNSALGGVIQITSGPKLSGEKAAKLPSDGSRIGYQLVTVEANTQYTLTYNYTMKTSPEGTLTVSILNGTTLNDLSEVAGATIASSTVNDQADANAYIKETLTFNSGSNTQVAIFFSNVGVESRLDDLSLAISDAFMPVVSEAGFEPNDPTGSACGDAGSSNGKDCWRSSELGGVIQITSGPKNSGEKAAKLPSDGSRIGYQLVDVEANTKYRVSFFYTMKTSPEGSLTVSILDGSPLADLAGVAGATIASITVNDQTDANAYIMESIEFNSGSNSQISIFFSNVAVESRLDDFSITTL